MMNGGPPGEAHRYVKEALEDRHPPSIKCVGGGAVASTQGRSSVCMQRTDLQANSLFFSPQAVRNKANLRLQDCRKCGGGCSFSGSIHLSRRVITFPRLPPSATSRSQLKGKPGISPPRRRPAELPDSRADGASSAPDEPCGQS